MSARLTRRAQWIGVPAAALLALAAVPMLAAGRATALPAGDTGTASAVTVSGHAGRYDDFSALRVTVSQTRDLTHQGITISWSGGLPTQPDNGFAVDYLQIMQCWGDPAAVDFRQTCQFGANVTAPGAGATNIRDIRIDPADPAEQPAHADAQMIPFTSALTGETTPDGSTAQPYPDGAVHSWDVLSPFFNKYSSNEVPYARTAADGTGRIVFEVQTTVEAPQLGCGKATSAADGSVTGTPCSLVIVPRGSHNATGSAQDAGSPLVGSPLSTTFWADRIVVPLQFQPVGGFCQLGQAERRTAGSELIAEAMTSWQPTLCSSTSTVYGYATTSDADAREQVRLGAGGNVGMAFTNQPVLAGSGDAAVIHAPVALSGVVIAYNIDAKINPTTPEDLLLQGQAVRQLKLTPLLVAKLLTQSYKRDVPGGQQGVADYLGDNPTSIRNDPDFLALNPFFAKFTPQSGPDGLMTAYGDSDSATAVWRWVLSDPVAAQWLAGKPEIMPDGKKFVVNKYYLDLAADGVPDHYLKSDRSCQATSTDPAALPFCTLDLRPYLNSMHETALQSLRADAKVKITFDPLKVPPQLTQSDPQAVGTRFEMAVTDSASAARFGLFTATLCDNSGAQCVDATPASLLAGEQAMVPSAVPGVLQTDPLKHVAGAYPLTMLTYAAVSTALPVDARQAYATMLRYAAGAGQTTGTQLGQLPAGYAPLPADLAVRTQAAAKQLAEYVSPVAAPVHTPTVAAAPGTTPAAQVPSAPGIPTHSSATPLAVVNVQYTPAQHLGSARFVLIAVAGGGLGAAILGPVLLSLAGPRSRRYRP